MKKALCWIRRDLRLHDHHALSRSLKDNDETYLCFIFDSHILNKLDDKSDRRLTFIYESLNELESKLQKINSSLIIRYGSPVEEIPKLVEELNIDALYFNRDYEPYAKKRDQAVEKIVLSLGKKVHHYKDHVFYEKKEIKNNTGGIYKVFTPYKHKWLETWGTQEQVVPNFTCPLEKLSHFTNPSNILVHDWWRDIGFIKNNNLIKGGSDLALKKLQLFKEKMHDYSKFRDFPYLNQTSCLSTYIRMGNLSIRDMIRAALENNNKGSQAWLSELIWRDFYQMILDAYPRVEKHCFKIEYDALKWPGEQKDFLSWCEGQTGYPLIDAAMRCLNTTGFMHNRLRMVVASFLTKTLLIDWKKGERYFASKLMDYDLAANNGGWQWSASTGVDAQPYFRIFNPYAQSLKFDPKGEFIRSWCPELKGFSDKDIHAPHDTEFPVQDGASCFIGRDYPAPIVSYKEQKEKALSLFKRIPG